MALTAIPQTAADKRWQRELDARTLIDAATIEADPKRKKEALKAAKVIAEEKAEESAAAAKVASRKSPQIKSKAKKVTDYVEGYR